MAIVSGCRCLRYLIFHFRFDILLLSSMSHTATAATFEPKFTSVSNVGNLTITAKNVQSVYLQTETSAMLTRLPHEVPVDASDILVIQYGSRNVKIGTARDALPRVVPQVIAHRNAGFKGVEWPSEELPEEELQERLALRYKQARKKPPPNIYSSLVAHNKAVVSQAIPALNDAYGFEWTRTRSAPFLTGKEALRCNPSEPYRCRWPIRRGNFNQIQYQSYRQVLDDLDKIWTRIIVGDVKIARKDLVRYGLVLVVPDAARAWEIKALTELAIGQMGFRCVSFLYESLSGTFGTGVSASLVVDVGAQSTKVCCVEDGQILKASQSLLPYGGDELTRLLATILKHHSFPYEECDLSRQLDWDLMDELKMRMCTLDEHDLASVVHEAYVRTPGQATRVYPFKIFEERFIVPSALFEDGVPLLQSYIARKPSSPSGDAANQFYTEESALQIYYTNSDYNLESDQNHNQFNADSTPNTDIPGSDATNHGDLANAASDNDAPLSLIEAIIKALDAVDSSGTNPEKLKKFLSSILVIGNGQRFPRFVAHLESLLRQRYPAHEIDFVLGGAAGSVSGKENLVLDSGIVAWKGGAVFGKLECVLDAWISRRDLETCGVRAFRERLLFNIL